MWSKRLHSASDTDHLRYEKVSLSRIQPTPSLQEDVNVINLLLFHCHIFRKFQTLFEFLISSPSALVMTADFNNWFAPKNDNNIPTSICPWILRTTHFYHRPYSTSPLQLMT